MPTTDSPKKLIFPSDKASRPAIILMVVVFPEPLGPIIEKNSPCCTSNVTPSTATYSPKRLDTFSRLTAGEFDAVLPESDLALSAACRSVDFPTPSRAEPRCDHHGYESLRVHPRHGYAFSRALITLTTSEQCVKRFGLGLRSPRPVTGPSSPSFHPRLLAQLGQGPTTLERAHWSHHDYPASNLSQQNA